MTNKLEASPMMHEYLVTKEKYKDCILFYRLGDFYEMFYEDAIEASKILELTLTSKNCGGGKKAPMCGVPHHASEIYISRLVHAGKKVAICEQLSQPEPGKIVARDVVRVITPGTITEDALLPANENNYIAFIFVNDPKCLGVAYCDVSTGEFCLAQYDGEVAQKRINDILTNVNPSEIIVNESGKKIASQLQACRINSEYGLQTYPDWSSEFETAVGCLQNQFGINCLLKYELLEKQAAVCAGGGLMHYLKETQKNALSHINKIKTIKNDQFLILDSNTRRNLELTETIMERRKRGSLLSVIDKTNTSMGGRMLRSWLVQPLRDERDINARLDSVEEIIKSNYLKQGLVEVLSKMSDIQRIVAKISYNSVTPKECLALSDSLEKIPEIKNLLKNCTSKLLSASHENLDDFSDVVNLINSAISRDCPANLKDGGYIKAGFNEQLDELRDSKNNAIKWTMDLEKRYKETTGIKNLKIGYNRVFGYYIEVPTALIDSVPIDWRRKQTVSTNERYINQELKEIESKILHSKEDAILLEHKIYAEIKVVLSGIIEILQQLGNTIAQIDCLCSLASASINNFYNRPKISSKVQKLKIVQGRHPVVELLNKNRDFIPNDTLLDNSDNNIMIITGPNMAGKSTYMRQVAVISLLAHIGSFVPAKQAEIPIMDRIFTRVGASDDLSFGQSTFMVEMSEVSTILANATNKSLVILDEIGRGTSTFDGMSIAWSVVEYIANELNCMTLFATHYHELGELEGKLRGVKNYKVNVKEFDNQVIFLRTISRGSANRSFGIEVASLAGLPQKVIDRSKEICKHLDQTNITLPSSGAQDVVLESENIHNKYKKMKDILQCIEVDQMTPLAAFDILCQLMNVLKG